MSREYKCLSINEFEYKEYSIVPIRDDDKYIIMQMRNDQLFHLRQKELLTKETQEKYFSTTISSIFEEK